MWSEQILTTFYDCDYILNISTGKEIQRNSQCDLFLYLTTVLKGFVVLDTDLCDHFCGFKIVLIVLSSVTDASVQSVCH